MNVQGIAALYGRLMILVYVQKCLFLEVAHLCEFNQLRFVVFILLTDLLVLPSNLQDYVFTSQEESDDTGILLVQQKLI